MVDEKEYVERLEKIVDKQDALLTQLDAKFRQQETLNNTLNNQNKILREDIKKHKDLLMDMNKTVNQHKNVVKKLKKELEDQLKIQQDLHKDYGEVIKGLTEELEEEKNKNSAPGVQQNSVKPPADNKPKSNKVELPPKEHQTDYVGGATNMLSDIKDKSSEAINDVKNNPNAPINNNPQKNVCPNCGADIEEGYIFCESCGTKVA